MPWVELFRYSITENQFPPDQHYLLSLLDKYECSRFERYKFDQGRWTFATARWLAKINLAKHLDIDPSEVTFSYNENGKPFLSCDSASDCTLHFSISHTESAIVVAISNQAIGVDVEQKSRRGEPWLNVKAFLNERIAKIIDPLQSEAEKQIYFLRYWTMMEAQVKLLGESLFSVKENFGFNLPVLTQDGLYSDGHYTFYTADSGAGEHISVCVADQLNASKIESFNDRRFVTDPGLKSQLGL